MITKLIVKCKCNSIKKKKFCLTCKETLWLCPLCENEHNKDNNNKHIIIDYDKKNYCCLEHNKSENQFNFYCHTCQKDFCSICFNIHKNHQIESLSEIYFLKDKLILKQKELLSIKKEYDQEIEKLLRQRDNIEYTYQMNEIIIKNYNIDNMNYTNLCNYKEIYEKNFNIQKINKLVINLNNITNFNINYQEININNISNSIKNEEMIKEQNQEIKEYSSIISYNKTQFLSVSHNSFNIQRFYEKIENNNKPKKNLYISENAYNNNGDEKISNFTYILPDNRENNKEENEEQNDEDDSEIKVDNNNINIIFFDENNYSEDNNILSDINENEENESEEKINSCDKKESIEEQYNNVNNNYQRIIKRKKVKNRIKIIYRNKGNKQNIRIFGKNFVKNNKDKCYIIYEDTIYELTEKFEVKNNKKILEIYLEGIDKITDASEMFCDCLLLTNLEDISEWDTSNITNMSKMFMNCESLSFLDISKWNVINVTNIKYMFYGLKNLKKLSDLSGWNTSNVTNMSHLFENCESLPFLPDISKWNIINATDISHLFGNCRSLSSLPDISRWSTDSIIDMSHLFENCESLESLPDISKWNVKNVKNMEYMLFCCLRLKTITIPKKIFKVEDISYLYYGCDSLENEPDLKEWNLNKIKKKENFNGNCFKLKKKINS